MNKAQIGYQHPLEGEYAPIEEFKWQKATYPLGAHYLGDDVTFAVYSKNATRILLEIYQKATGEEAKYDYWLHKNPVDNIWRAHIKGIPPGTFYAFRCWGPNWQYDPNWRRGNSNIGFEQDVDSQGNRFNPNKVLYDPYTREISHDRKASAMYATGGLIYNGVISREYDTGKWSPKGVILAPEHSSTGKRPYLPPEKAAIYETHLKGLTMHPSASNLETILKGIPGYEEVVNVPVEKRGTYAGAAYLAKYLKALGLTTIEFLPVQETPAEGNYWGYMTFGYFAPVRRYAYDQSPGGPTREFKEMVKAFHEEGIEVYLDVVYNHTGEGGNWGHLDITGFASFGGFDAVEYYQQTNEYYLVDGATGCGNQLNFSSQITRNLVIDSLTYWLTEMGVDGFRFDLATVLGRTPNAFERENWQEQKRFFQQHPLLLDIKELGDKYQAEMIAEAWDIWGYEVGNFPSGWGEWNGNYRDTVRKFCRGDGNTLDFIDTLNGDYRLFNDNGGPQRSIDFIVAHDGFTLMDVVSYNQKNNQLSYPFGPSDGGCDQNYSSDCDGDRSLRRQRLRNFWTLLFFSRGVPMVVWGDEFGRTQNGNNNPYNIDSVATWNNYNMINTNQPNSVATGFDGIGYHDNFGTANSSKDCNPLFRFVTYVANLRKQHVGLKQHQYGDMLLDFGKDVSYIFTKCDGVSSLNNGDRCLILRIDGSEVGDHDFLLLINMFSEAINFTVPYTQGQWRCIIDTAAWAESEYNYWSLAQAQVISMNYWVQGFSVVVLEEIL
ncbi:MAG: glycogen-debranching protein [Gloeocapsa sp. DLM2.Bin57]|nr:MAG: glycogen-debranching protein [Gloeocapsa sp. DLM2.Bin57]